jgi:ribose transport system permease protein
MSKTSTVKGQRLTAQGIVKRIFQIREIVILLLVLLLAGFMALNHPQFMSMPNMRIICNYMATDMIIAAFLTISLIAGNTDFSVGSNMGCSAFVCGLWSVLML